MVTARSSLHELLHPMAITQMREAQHSTSVERAKTRGRVRKQVLNCTSCQLHTGLPGGHRPVAFSSGKKPAFVAVGEAPGPEESARGEPFIGKSGRLIRSLMTKVGINPETDVLWCNTVSCFPNVEGQIRAPSESEQSMCRSNLMAQIEAGYTRYVLLIGAKAANAFRSDIQVTKHHGQVFVWNELYCVMPIIHPAAALRGKRAYKKDIERDLERWVDVVWGGDDPLSYLGDTCLCCVASAETWDRDGVPYCKHHYERWKDHWRKDRIRWNEKIEQLSF